MRKGEFPAIVNVRADEVMGNSLPKPGFAESPPLPNRGTGKFIYDLSNLMRGHSNDHSLSEN